MMEKNITAIIIDDEQSARKILKSILESYCPHITLLGEANSISSGKALIKEVNPHVIFLDVEMPGGSGFDLLKEIGPIQSEIIFTTAHNHYAINAIRSFALDYLLKPINPQELVEAVSKIKHKDVRMTYKLIDLLSQQLVSKKEYADQLAIPSANGFEIIKVEDVMYCEGDGNYTTFYLAGDQKLVSSKTLKEYERILPTLTFVRAHQKYLVNIKFVKRYLKGRGGTLIMTNGKSIDVAHSKRTQVIEALG
jgi:two-component system LytT family response regulator